MRPAIFFLGALSSAALFAFACSSSEVDDSELVPPDSGAQPDANYCVSDFDCPPDDKGNQFACGFPIADTCEARGVCVAVIGSGTKCSAPDYCGCEGDFVTTCPLADPSYVRNGPTNGSKPQLLADGGLTCGS